ncbi:hypothetical protein DFQ28_004000 [Apophysomyces sp. BC1034]|nr:hypothetical protein DFQ29_003312 [Apophysomyces sp. BC1021]KAG0178042.1 hypothetical protein DFQ28_004000 [Apophysomyces sp. BC1034]
MVPGIAIVPSFISLTEALECHTMMRSIWNKYPDVDANLLESLSVIFIHSSAKGHAHGISEPVETLMKSNDGNVFGFVLASKPRIPFPVLLEPTPIKRDKTI